MGLRLLRMIRLSIPTIIEVAVQNSLNSENFVSKSFTVREPKTLLATRKKILFVVKSTDQYPPFISKVSKYTISSHADGKNYFWLIRSLGLTGIFATKCCQMVLIAVPAVKVRAVQHKRNP